MLPVQIGTPNNGGSVVTAGGLIFIGAATGALPVGGQANPISYKVAGRQYVLIAPGGHHFMGTGVSDEIIAYASE